MKFNDDNYPPQPKHGSRNNEISDSVAEEHPKHIIAVAEQRITAMHSHDDGSSVELHEIGSREFIQQSIQSSIEGKLGNNNEWQPQPTQNENSLAAARIEYEKKSSQNQPTQLYGSQQSVTGALFHKQETFMMGCNCGAEWTVTGQSTKADANNPAAVKVEQYGSAAGGGAGYNVSGGGSGPGEYRAGGGQREDYKG